MLDQLLRRIKAWIDRREKKPVPPAHPCRVCGDAGFYATRNGWLCPVCQPPFLRQTGHTAKGYTFVSTIPGDPRG